MVMPAEAWAGAAVSFLGMWVVMTAAMMLPSIAPQLWRYRRAHGVVLAAVVAAGYLMVWAAFGVLAFPLLMVLPGVARAGIGVVVLIAGAWQLTAWKARHLACCRHMPAPNGMLSSGARAAWRDGVRLGLYCGRCCGNLMVIPLAVGAMDVRAMAVVGVVIALERIAPSGIRVARATGYVIMGGGLLVMARAAGVA